MVSCKHFLNKKYRYKRASPSFISHLCEREMQILTPFSSWQVIDSEKYGTKFNNITTALPAKFIFFLAGFIRKTKPILPVRAVEKGACCLSVVYSLMVD